MMPLPKVAEIEQGTTETTCTHATQTTQTSSSAGLILQLARHMSLSPESFSFFT